MTLKICVNAISKNEEQFVKRFCNSAKDADLILIADTGSTDKTVELAKECGATVYDICISPWRFDAARNVAIALTPKDFDIIVSLDLDEVLEEGWREEIERVWELGKTTRLRYLFDWGQGIRFRYEKIFARHGYSFFCPVHEYPIPDLRITEVYAETDKLLVSHYPDPTKSRGQYLDLLRMSVKENPREPRNAFYFARELTFYSLWDEAIAALNTYLNMPEATWPNERCYAMRLLGKAYDHKQNPWEALKWYRMAIAEAPGTREPWVDAAMSYYMKSMWKECFHASTMALEIKDKQLVYTCDPEVWGYKPYDLAAIAAYNLGLKDEAIRYGQAAVDLSPNDERLARNLEYYGLANAA
jgi:glycosyltransferase involved in cell wall biosynthesis